MVVGSSEIHDALLFCRTGPSIKGCTMIHRKDAACRQCPSSGSERRTTVGEHHPGHLPRCTTGSLLAVVLHIDTQPGLRPPHRRDSPAQLVLAVPLHPPRLDHDRVRCRNHLSIDD